QGLLIGAAAGLAWGSGRFEGVAPELRRVLAAVGAMMLGLTVLGLDAGDPRRFAGGTTVISLAAAAIVVVLAGGGPSWLKRPLEWAPLRYVGSRSYALYLWHYPMATWTRSLGWPG